MSWVGGGGEGKVTLIGDVEVVLGTNVQEVEVENCVVLSIFFTSFAHSSKHYTVYSLSRPNVAATDCQASRAPSHIYTGLTILTKTLQHDTETSIVYPKTMSSLHAYPPHPTAAGCTIGKRRNKSGGAVRPRVSLRRKRMHRNLLILKTKTTAAPGSSVRGLGCRILSLV